MCVPKASSNQVNRWERERHIGMNNYHTFFVVDIRAFIKPKFYFIAKISSYIYLWPQMVNCQKKRGMARLARSENFYKCSEKNHGNFGFLILFSKKKTTMDVRQQFEFMILWGFFLFLCASFLPFHFKFSVVIAMFDCSQQRPFGNRFLY